MREWLVIEKSWKNAVFAPDDAKTPVGYIPRDAAEQLLGRDLGETTFFTRKESELMQSHPEWRKTLEPMTDDTAAGLTEILTALRNDRPLHAVDWERHLTDAISRLATPPLPDEIAGLIEFHDKAAAAEPSLNEITMHTRVADALRALAQENERLKAADWSDIGAVSVLKGRIAKLEAEQDKAHASFVLLRAERGAIRAKTFEECLELTDDRAECWHTEARRQAARDIGGAIRALAQSSTSAQTDEASAGSSTP